jgi:hypothetical protein
MQSNGHWYMGEPGDERCGNCDCRPYGRWAQLPCGTTELPEGVQPLSPTEFATRAVMHASIMQMIAEDVANEIAFEGGQP